MNEVLIDENVIGETLTARQEAFCQYYTQISSLFGNATLAYAEAYDFGLDELSHEKPVLAENEEGEPTEWGDSEYSLAYNVCSVSAHKLLRNAKIDRRVRTLLNDMMTNEVIDARLVEIIMKGKDQDSIAAIKEFNKLKQRIVEKKDITSNGESIAGFNFVRAEQFTSGYSDSRTVEEKEADSKIEMTTTSTAMPEPTIASICSIHRIPDISCNICRATFTINDQDNADNQTHS